MLLSKPIENITPFSLIDFPDLTSCIIWFKGCNMRCAYCYNPDIIFGKGKISFDQVYSFLNKRINLLDGVVLSGGECTLNKDLKSFVSEIKKLGFKVKIDTNGTNPFIIKELINLNLIDFISLDIKSLENKFYEITKSKKFNEVIETFTFLNDFNFPFEVRTTYHNQLLNPTDINQIIDFLKTMDYKGKYYIQNFFNNVKTIVDLPSSMKIKLEELNTNHIPVLLRNA